MYDVMTGKELKSAQRWCELLDARIMDPDGWRNAGVEWDEPITKERFDELLIPCTIDTRGYPLFVGR